MAQEKQPQRKKIEATGQMMQIMSDYFYDLNAAAKSAERKVAWCTSVGPAELLRAMGFAVHFPENHAAMLGATRMATELIPEANTIGYSPEICSYLTADIGAYLKHVSPLAKAYPGIEAPPRPDVLVFNTNQCRDVQDWFSWYAKELNVPCIGICSPKNHTEVSEVLIDDVSRQIEALIPTLEEVSGQPLDLQKLREVVALSRECTELWRQVLETAAAAPAPLTFFDATIHMGPAVVLRGTPQAVAYYRRLLAELQARINSGTGAVDDEQFRIYWEGMPVWGRLRQHSELFAGLQTSVLVSTYCSSWIFPDFDPLDPIRSMAKAYLSLFIVRSDAYKETYIKRMLEKFHIDGIIYHDAKTCPCNSNSRYGMPQRLEQQTGIPSLVISGDLNDLRCVSDEQTITNVEAFIEQLEERKHHA
ncbi:2-hydroxyacyl-CoA dehydratase subunit D [Geopsychrobacter electrodiphilus]|uniref:2-hydroxyacyl-CoA dehydratase subunit D n=1 Tax=Geopsychrobacter electrodiphilus TaxID=225196 RepID=UPI000366B773|nr:2-hydroxyacyl-CoA dehydratase family protein [Geopsychrobacter electrodiphilus]